MNQKTASDEEFGRVLHDARTKAGFDSRRAFAAKINYNAGYLTKVENGQEPATESVVAKYDEACHLDGELLRLLRKFSRGHLNSLPPLVSLVGREKEQVRITQFFAGLTDPRRMKAPRVLLIYGLPTSGTSALATWAAHTARADYPDGIHYHDLEGYGPPSHQPRDPGEVLGDLLRELDVPSFGESLPERIRHYRTALASGPGRRHRRLIVLDNARDAEQIGPLLPGAAATDTAVIITSYSPMTNLVGVEKERLVVSPLTTTQATGLLRRDLATQDHPVAEQPEVVTQLADLADGSALALRLMAEWVLSTHPEKPTEDLLGEAREFRDVTAGRSCPVRERILWLLDTVSSNAAELFRLLGLWRTGTASLPMAALAALAGREISDTRRLVTELVQANLLTQLPRSRYAMPLLAANAAAVLPRRTDPEITAAATRRIVSWYLHTTGGASAELARWRSHYYTDMPPGVRPHHHRNAHEAIQWLQAERDAIREACRVAQRAGLHTECWQFSLALRGWLEIESDLNLWVETHERGYFSALQSFDRLAVATVQTQQAEGFRRLSRRRTADSSRAYALAKNTAEAAVEQWRETAVWLPGSISAHYIKYYGGVEAVRAVLQRGQAWAWRIVAMLRRDYRLPDEALEAAERALDLLGPNDHQDRALTQGLLADILRGTPGLAELEAAEQLVQEALGHLWHVGGASRLEAWVHSVRAEVHLTWAGEHTDVTHLGVARDALTQSVRAVKRTGDQAAEGLLLARLSEVQMLVDVYGNAAVTGSTPPDIDLPLDVLVNHAPADLV